jgi:hypothetical protein
MNEAGNFPPFVFWVDRGLLGSNVPSVNSLLLTAIYRVLRSLEGWAVCLASSARDVRSRVRDQTNIVAAAEWTRRHIKAAQCLGFVCRHNILSPITAHIGLRWEQDSVSVVPDDHFIGIKPKAPTELIRICRSERKCAHYSGPAGVLSRARHRIVSATGNCTPQQLFIGNVGNSVFHQGHFGLQEFSGFSHFEAVSAAMADHAAALQAFAVRIADRPLIAARRLK